jgi:lactate dehydrogenase-like 2-hydroxyacid dehydrogenase
VELVQDDARPRLLVMTRQIEAMVRPPEGEFALLRLDDAGDRDGFLREHGRGVEALLTSGLERLDKPRLELLPDLRLIAVVAAGYSAVDVDEAQRRGIAVTNAGDLNAADVADYAVTMLLAHRREVIANDAWVREDRWPGGRRPPGRSIARQRVGIVGLGHIGRAVAERLAPFGCEIGWWGPRPKPAVPWARYDSVAALAEWATTLVVAARGDDSSRGLIDRAVLDALGADGLIVNVSRGFVIDQAELFAALREGRLGGAALDVFEPEPMRASDVADVPNLLMAPHVAGATREALAAVMAAALDNVRRHYAGAPLLHRVV